MLTAGMIKDYALECGVDAVGIGTMDRFDGAPMEMDPRFVFPNARSVICMVFRIPRGFIRGIEEGTHFYQYPSMGYGGINEDFAPTVLYQVGRLIEDHGYEAGVFRNAGGRGPISDVDGRPGATISPEEGGRAVRFTRPMKPGLPPPDIIFQFRLAAFICGLGEIGYSKMLLTPQFGPLSRQAFIFTDAPLEPDPLYDGPPLCDKCKVCVAQCPGHCISGSETVKVTVAGRELEWGKLDEWSCHAYYMGAARESDPFIPPDASPEYPHAKELFAGEWRVQAKEYGDINRLLRSYYPGPTSGYNPPKCGGCIGGCLASLERRKVLTNSFVNRFRTGKPWKFGKDQSSDE